MLVSKRERQTNEINCTVLIFVFLQSSFSKMSNGTGTSATASASAASMGNTIPTIMSGAAPNIGSVTQAA